LTTLVWPKEYAAVKRPTFSSPRGFVPMSLHATILSVTVLMIAAPAFAALGDDASSVQTDVAHMQGSLRITQSQAFTVHEIAAATGTTVREYASPSGKIFAVAWEGPWLPNMRQLLSSYFTQYEQALQSGAPGRAGRKPVLIEQPGLVVQSGGHMRSFSGRAYIPQMMPQGVRAEEIR
jgi:hypothetical protein